jgi:hypothetical protein
MPWDCCKSEAHDLTSINSLSTLFDDIQITERERPLRMITNEENVLLEKYKQGSQCCQQYSKLTMTVRTLSQQIMIGYAVGIGLFLAKSDPWPPPHLAPVMIFAGIVIILFAGTLSILNYHHSTAFVSIRDFLSEFEGNYNVDKKPRGPWQAQRQRRERDGKLTRVAWHLPYLVLALVGISSVIVGLFWTPL